MRQVSVPGKKFRNSFWIENLQNFCEHVDGQLQNVSVPEGTFPACFHEFQTSTLNVREWYAEKTPFALIKSSSDDGTSDGLDTHERVSSGNE